MILILQIALSVSAWKKGWRAWAMLPVGITAAVGFAVGIASGTQDVLSEYMPFVLLFDIASVIILAIMCSHAPEGHVISDNSVGHAVAEEKRYGQQ